MYFRKPGQYSNKRRYPQGGRKRRIGRGIRQLQKVATDVAKLKESVNTEYKYCDFVQNGAPNLLTIPQATVSNPNNAVNMLLNEIPQGTDYDERTGTEAKIKSLQLTCIISAKDGILLNQRVRMIIFLYLRPTGNGAVPPVTELLQSAASGNTLPMVAQRNLDNRSRFSILYDRTFGLEPYGVVGSQRVIKIYKRLNFHTIWERSETGDEGSGISKNALYMYMFSDSDNAAETACFSRVRYVDN